MNNVNIFRIHIDQFFKKVNDNAVLCRRVNSHLLDYKKTLIDRFSGSNDELSADIRNGKYPFMATALIIEDITSNSNTGIFHTKAFNSLYHSDIEDHFSELLTREYYLALSSCFEVLKRFIRDITAEYIFLNQDRIPRFSLFANIQAIRDEFASNNFRKGKNEKELFKVIREYCPSYVIAEENNNWEVNLYSWFYVLAEVRNGIVHSYPKIIPLSEERGLSIDRKEILHKMFEIEVVSENLNIKRFSKESPNVKSHFNRMAEFAFILYKCYCKDSNIDFES